MTANSKRFMVFAAVIGAVGVTLALWVERPGRLGGESLTAEFAPRASRSSFSL